MSSTSPIPASKRQAWFRRVCDSEKNGTEEPGGIVMMVKRVFYALAAAMIACGLSAPSHVRSQQTPPCANLPTAGKTDKQMHMDICNCEQASAQDKPTYRVGAAPFGRNAKPPVVR